MPLRPDRASRRYAVSEDNTWVVLTANTELGEGWRGHIVTVGARGRVTRVLPVGNPTKPFDGERHPTSNPVFKRTAA
jgi:hypothetical protein